MTICQYSSGAASAIATKLMLDAGHTVRVVKAETNSEHEDNERFDREVSDWLGIAIEYLHNGKYHDVDEVIEKNRFIVSPQGARCTTELKKKVNRIADPYLESVHVFGFTWDREDWKRAIRRQHDNPEMQMLFPLIDQRVTKADCFKELRKVGIRLPVMYELGFKNNNCIGCVKADSFAYWLKTLEHFPETYWKRAKQEREIGHTINRIDGQPVYLDELQEYLTKRKWAPGQTSLFEMPSFSCDFLCAS